MLFETPPFALFALASLLAFHAAPGRLRRPLLVALSVGYAATFSLVGVALLVAEAVTAWFFMTRIRRHDDDAPRLRNVAAALVLLLGALATFKYAAALSGGVLGIVAPVGISYYTFKLVGLVLDTHWDKLKANPAVLQVLGYAAFFPQLLSGPIQRPQDWFSQEEKNEPPSGAELSAGMRLILFGLFKKLVVADRVGVWVDQVYARPEAHGDATVTLACYLYALQLYADFSGYTDVALGLGRLFGIRGPPNFARPWSAPTVQDFWRRWHISLSSWLTDYLFTPLRMALRSWGDLGLVASLAATMLAIGIWHGPRWTYVAFGALNAVYLVGSALTLKRRDQAFARRPGLARVRRLWQPLIVLHLMVVAFILFRAPSLQSAIDVGARFVRGFAGLPAAAIQRTLSASILGWSWQHTGVVAGGALLMAIVHRLQAADRLDEQLVARPLPVRWGLYYALVAGILLFRVQGAQGNIYFKF